MPRRFSLNPDFMQSVPRAARERKPASNEAPPMPVKPRTTVRQHWARVVGAATLASVLAFALAISPGANPDAANGAQALERITQPAPTAQPASMAPHTRGHAAHKRPAREV